MRASRFFVACAAATAIALSGCSPAQEPADQPQPEPEATHVLLYVEQQRDVPEPAVEDFWARCDWQVLSADLATGESTVVVAGEGAVPMVEPPQLSPGGDRLLYLSPQHDPPDYVLGGLLVQMDLVTGTTSTPVPQLVSSYGWAGDDIIACTLEPAVDAGGGGWTNPHPNGALRFHESELTTIVPSLPAIPRPPAEGAEPTRAAEIQYMGVVQQNLYFLEETRWSHHGGPGQIWRLAEGSAELELVKDVQEQDSFFRPLWDTGSPQTQEYESFLHHSPQLSYREHLAVGVLPIERHQRFLEAFEIPDSGGGFDIRSTAETHTLEVYDPATMELLWSRETTRPAFDPTVVGMPAWSADCESSLEMRSTEESAGMHHAIVEIQTRSGETTELVTVPAFLTIPTLTYVRGASARFVYTQAPQDGTVTVMAFDPAAGRSVPLLDLPADKNTPPRVELIGAWTPPAPTPPR